MTYFQRLFVNTITFISLTVILPNQMFHVSSWVTAVLAAFVLSILNGFIRPFLLLLSLPFTVLTLGLFTFVVNGLMLTMTSKLLGEASFGFSSFWAAVLVAIIMSVVNLIVTDHNMSKYEKEN